MTDEEFKKSFDKELNQAKNAYIQMRQTPNSLLLDNPIPTRNQTMERIKRLLEVFQENMQKTGVTVSVLEEEVDSIYALITEKTSRYSRVCLIIVSKNIKISYSFEELRIANIQEYSIPVDENVLNELETSFRKLTLMAMGDFTKHCEDHTLRVS